MSRSDIYRPPVIRPELKKRWDEYWAKEAKRWARDHEPLHRYLPTGERVEDSLPQMRRRTLAFVTNPVPRLEWSDARYGNDRVPTTSWSEGSLTVVVRQIPDQREMEDDFVTLTDHPSETGRQAWKKGVHDRKYGGRWRGNREYRYLVVEDYDYDNLRKYFWFKGYSKLEADAMARHELKARIRYAEESANGETHVVGVEAVVYEDDEETDAVASTSFWGIEVNEPDDPYLDDVARDVAEQALNEAKLMIRRRFERYQLVLKGLGE